MPFKVQVGPPQIAIHQGQTVLVSEPDGQINWPSDKGLYFLDTRIVSSWAIYANGEPWELLNGGPVSYYAPSPTSPSLRKTARFFPAPSASRSADRSAAACTNCESASNIDPTLIRVQAVEVSVKFLNFFGAIGVSNQRVRSVWRGVNAGSRFTLWPASGTKRRCSAIQSGRR
jgi:hypothetical protein